ncbi:hypothetical protein P3T17_000548 [Paraburkholderia sp. GAS82]
MHPIAISPVLLTILLACPILLAIIIMICGCMRRARLPTQSIGLQLGAGFMQMGPAEARRFWAVIALMTGALLWLVADLIAHLVLHALY